MTQVRWPDDRAMQALAAALRTMPVDTDRAWARVRAAWSRPSTRLRWPAAASVSLAAVFLALAQSGVMRALAQPTFAAELAPAPRAAVLTPSLGREAAPLEMTGIPERVLDPTPVPLPPGQS